MTPSEQLAAIADDAWANLTADEPYYAAKAGLPVERIARGDLAQADANAAKGRRRLEQLAAIPDTGLSRTERLTKATLAWLAEADTTETEVRLTTFGVAPYQASGMAMTPPMVFQPYVFDGGAGDERYLSLVSDFAANIQAQSERIEAQVERGWRLPKPALPTARATVAGLGQKLAGDLLPSAERLAAAKPGLGDRISALVDDEVRPAFARLLDSIGEDYEADAPETVGMGQYPGGEDAYRLQLKLQLSWPAEPDELHAKGLDEVARLADAMAALRSRAFGFDGDEADFHARLQGDPKAKAASPEALAATFRRHLARMEPRIPSLFERGPQAEHDVERLAPELEAGMTFGFYRPPQPGQPKGIYFYSCLNLPDRLQMNAAPLIFHELLPGHHFHIARQGELAALPAIRREAIAFNAFNEGWAEYAASLGEEEGLYDDPYDLYGWLSHQRFVSQRLVVDTGLNALGWSLDQARAYMSANTLEGPTQVASETLRYSTDLPAQALAYRFGFLKIRELRQRAKDRLGAGFDIKGWHEAILSQGGLPLTVLDQSLTEWEAGQHAGAEHVPA